jgi:hypothetical protein
MRAAQAFLVPTVQMPAKTARLSQSWAVKVAQPLCKLRKWHKRRHGTAVIAWQAPAETTVVVGR